MTFKWHHTLTRSVRSHFGPLACLLVLAALCSGCGVTLKGKVVVGPTPRVLVVSADDPRLEQQGVAGAELRVTLDPHSMNPTRLGVHETDEQGRFSIPVDAPGAGLLMYDIGVICSAKGYQDVYDELALPGSNRWLLIVTTAGSGGYRPAPDILDETMKMKDELLSR